MSEIKFRGQDKSGKFVYGDLIHHKNKFAIIPDSYRFIIMAMKNPSQLGSTIKEVDPESVAQLVGYYEDGEEIYEAI